MIVVGKRWDKDAQYIGHPSPLGNPFIKLCEAARSHVCNKYEEWFEEQLEKKNPKVVAELTRLQILAESSDLTLGCYCAPKRCHGDTIKNYLEKHHQNLSA